MTCAPGLEAPLLMKAQAGEVVGRLAPATNRVHISELFAVVASIFARREKLRNRKLIALVDDEAAYAAPTKGIKRAKEASLLAYYAWALAAKINILLRVEGAPAAVKPAGAPPRGKQLRFQARLSGAMPRPHQMTSYRVFFVNAAGRAYCQT